MPELVGLIPAAGKGTRAYPYTRDIPKGMLKVAGRPLLEHAVELLRDKARVREIFLVVGTHGHIIQEHFGDGARFGLPITYIQNDRVDLGLAHSVRLAGRHIDSPFLMVLSDEYYQDTNHGQLAANPFFPADGDLGWCGLVPQAEPQDIRRNYTVDLGHGRIIRLQEKPHQPANDLLGTGTLLLSPRIFELLEKAFAQPGPPPDFMSVLGQAVERGELLRPFLLNGQYVNVNDVDSLNWANFLGRTKLLPQSSLSVVIQSKGEEEGLARLVEEFAAQPAVDEVLVVAPAEAAVPAWLDEQAKARWVACPPGCDEYGQQIALGLEQARGHLLAVVEGYYCFYPSDLQKLLAYISDADLVLGTRTTRQLIQQGSRMRGVVRLAHVLLAKLVEALWITHRVRLTDMGCTYRLIWRHCYEEIKHNVKAPGPEFAVEMTIETLRSRQRLIEVPVSFLHTNEELAERYQKPAVFMRMLATIIKRRLGLS